LKWESYGELSEINLICPSFPLFKQDQELRNEINDKKRRHTFNKNQIIFEKGMEADGVYIIIKGMAEETFESSNWVATQNRGCEVGYSNILCAENKNHDGYVNKSTLKSTMSGEYIFLETSLVQQIQDKYPEFQARIYKMALLSCLKGSSKSSL